MIEAKQGDTVTVHYKVMAASHEQSEAVLLHSTERRQPLRFVLGQESLLRAFDRAVAGMKVGESKTFSVPPEQAYGSRRDDLVWSIDRAEYPEGVDPEPGQRLELPSRSNGGRVKVRVTGVQDSTVTVDANHPLAGCPLTFEVSMLEIV